MNALEDKVVAYLDGELTSRETRAFERELTRPEVARALAEELAMRELFQSLPAELPPEGLTSRIEEALGIQEKKSFIRRLIGGQAAATADEPETSRGGSPAATGLRAGMDAWLGGMSTLRYAAGPLADAPEQLSRRAVALATPSRPLGRTALDAAFSTVRVVRSVSKLPLWTRILGLGKAR